MFSKAKRGWSIYAAGLDWKYSLLRFHKKEVLSDILSVSGLNASIRLWALLSMGGKLPFKDVHS